MLGAAVTACCMHIAPVLFSHRRLSDRLSACLPVCLSPRRASPLGLIKTWNRRSEFQIVESVKYYFNKIDQIMQPGYMASDDDILYARVRTSGIVTER